MSFSSYPGVLFSTDDFYMMHDTNLVMVETTNTVYNPKLFDKVVPESVLTWQRVRLSNSLATDGRSWYTTFREHNSGTYNNQYMILDNNKFTPQNALGAGTLWVIEQVGYLIHLICCWFVLLWLLFVLF